MVGKYTVVPSSCLWGCTYSRGVTDDELFPKPCRWEPRCPGGGCWKLWHGLVNTRAHTNPDDLLVLQPDSGAGAKVAIIQKLCLQLDGLGNCLSPQSCSTLRP